MVARLDVSDCPAPRWLPDGHTQTIAASVWAKYYRISFARERIDTPDGDFIDFDWAAPGVRASQLETLLHHDSNEFSDHFKPGQRALVLFHGLEGSSASPYAQAICHHFRARGWLVVVPHFRGCSGTPNRLPRAYHSGDSADIQFMLQTVRQRVPNATWYAAGVSLGGNALAKYLGEYPNDAQWLAANAIISAPIDLVAAGHTLGQGFVNRRIYTHRFLRTLKNKVLAKARRFPGTIDVLRVARAHDLYEFDDAYTAPLHGFDNVIDYWKRSSSLPWLARISSPTLVLNARNDPFLPERFLPGPHDASDAVLLHQPARGGHALFPAGTVAPNLNWLPTRLETFFSRGD